MNLYDKFVEKVANHVFAKVFSIVERNLFHKFADYDFMIKRTFDETMAYKNFATIELETLHKELKFLRSEIYKVRREIKLNNKKKGKK